MLWTRDPTVCRAWMRTVSTSGRAQFNVIQRSNCLLQRGERAVYVAKTNAWTLGRQDAKQKALPPILPTVLKRSQGDYLATPSRIESRAKRFHSPQIRGDHELTRLWTWMSRVRSPSPTHRGPWEPIFILCGMESVLLP
jgi:hypothetical protein